MRPLMRNEIVQIASRPLRAIRSGRFWLSPVVARLSPRHGMMMDSYRHEEEGRYAEALETWTALKRPVSSKDQAFRHTLRAARLEQKAGHYAEAVASFSMLHALNPGDQRVARGLESASLRAARLAQSEGRWLEACRMWAAFGRATARREKCRRNLRDCARYVAQSADSAQKIMDAIEAWGLLRAIDPESREARHGLEWCHVSLARAAERDGDEAAARRCWNALLEVAPGDRRALDGLERLGAAAR